MNSYFIGFLLNGKSKHQTVWAFTIFEAIQAVIDGYQINHSQIITASLAVSVKKKQPTLL